MQQENLKIQDYQNFVHDLIPIRFNDACSDDYNSCFSKYIDIVLDVSFKIICNSQSVADDVKDTAEDIGNRWTRSTTEEKITMVVGIVLLIRALYALRLFLG